LGRILDDMTMLHHITAPVRINDRLKDLRASWGERRQAKAARRSLEAELASYRTPAEVEDLFAALRRHDDAPTAEEMRTILFTNLVSSPHGRVAA
jgi:hypothetical protein